MPPLWGLYPWPFEPLSSISLLVLISLPTIKMGWVDAMNLYRKWLRRYRLVEVLEVLRLRVPKAGRSAQDDEFTVTKIQGFLHSRWSVEMTDVRGSRNDRL